MEQNNRKLSLHIIGDAFVDLLCFANTLPVFASDVRLKQPVTRIAGGSALNTATHLQSLVHDFSSTDIIDVKLQTCLNASDEYGKLLIDHARLHRIELINCVPNRIDSTAEDTSLNDTPLATGHCIVITTEGDRSFLTYLGVLSHFKASDLQSQEWVRKDSSAYDHHLHLHIAGYYNLQGFWNGALKTQLEDIRKQRHENGYTTTISLVPQSDATNQYNGQLLDVLPLLDILIMNEMEATCITGLSVPLDNVLISNSDTAMAEFFYTRNPQLKVVITLGEKGALVVQNGRVIGFKAPPISYKNPVDPTGAGDAFTAGFLFGSMCEKQTFGSRDNPSACLNTEDILHGLDWGCLIGTRCTMRQGASIPATKEELLDFMKETGHTIRSVLDMK